MCAVCQVNPAVLTKKLTQDDYNYSILSIRLSGKNFVFTSEHFSIIQQGNTYWRTPGIHVCGCCMKRDVVDNQISWIDHDYTSCGITYDGQLINWGNEMLNRVLKLKAFL
jgi:hypothetical protein